MLSFHLRRKEVSKVLVVVFALLLGFPFPSHVSGFAVGQTFSGSNPSLPCLANYGGTSTIVLFDQKPGSARFSGIQVEDPTSALDVALRALVSDIGSILIGLAGLIIAVTYRLANQDSLSAETLGQETRSDLLAVFACGAVLLNGVSKLDVTSALAESVVLDGSSLAEPALYHHDSMNNDTVRWALSAILAATPAVTVVLLEFDDTSKSSWRTVACAGIVPEEDNFRRGTTLDSNPILSRFLKDKNTETYLPTLQALPGKVEFSYLPPNTQEALLLPIISASTTSAGKVLVLGSNTAKSFTPRDIAWCRVLASRVANS